MKWIFSKKVHIESSYFNNSVDYINDTEMRAKMQFNVEYLEHLQTIISSPFEIIKTLYSTEIECVNSECINFQKKVGSAPGNETNESHMSDGELEKNRNIAQSTFPSFNI